MKKTLAACILACLALTGCTSNQQQCDIVKETYIHKYGVRITKSDWNEQGKEGQTVSLRTDGVTVSTSYSEGIVHGPTAYTFPNSSTIRYIDTYAFGELVAKKENYPSGVPFQEELFEENVLVKLTRWYEDGTPQAYEIYENSLLVSGEYRTPLNVIETRIQEGQGIRIWRSNEGDLLSKDIVKNGRLAERVSYYPNGDPWTITAFEMDVPHGTRLTYLQGGLPHTVEQWVRGVQEGMTVVYQNGEKIAEVTYVNGKKNGIEYRYRDGSILAEELTWKDNVQHGQHKIFVDNDIKSEWFHEGEVVSRTTFERMNLPRNLM